jgi:hypothetical protein
MNVCVCVRVYVCVLDVAPMRECVGETYSIVGFF